MAAAEPRKARAPASPAPTTPDPIEIAMEAEAGDASPDSPARRVLLKQAELIDADLRHRRLQIAGERMSNLLKVGIGLAGLAVAIALGLMAWSAKDIGYRLPANLGPRARCLPKCILTAW